jgi:hypothetical protein
MDSLVAAVMILLYVHDCRRPTMERPFKMFTKGIENGTTPRSTENVHSTCRPFVCTCATLNSCTSYRLPTAGS